MDKERFFLALIAIIVVSAGIGLILAGNPGFIASSRFAGPISVLTVVIFDLAMLRQIHKSLN